MKNLISKLFNFWFKIDRRVRFILVGGYNTVFALSLFYLLENYFGASFHYMAILLATHVIGIFNSFLTLRIFVFESKNSLLKEYLKVNVVYCGYFFANAALLFCLHEILLLDILLSQFLCVLILTIASYFAHKHFSFKTHP